MKLQPLSLFTLLTLCLLTSVPGKSATPVPAPPGLTAKSWALADATSGELIASQDADLPIEPASMTKIMTVYVVLDELESGNITLDEKVRISENAWRTEGSRMFVEVNTEVSVNELLDGVIVQSGNDASVALAEHIAGSEATFAQLMTQHAKKLGMKNTRFTNATGLPDDDHFTSARDLAILSSALIRRFPEPYTRFAKKSFVFNGITQHNRNRLLWWDESVDGLKTGHTETAGYCLVASGIREGTRLHAVVTGTADDKTRFVEAQSLLNYGFRFFRTHKLIGAQDPQTQATVMGGTQDQVSLGITQDLYVTIPRDRYDDLQAQVQIHPSIQAPVSTGTVLGALTVRLDDQTIAERPLVALEPVAEGSLFKRWKDQVLQWME